MAALSSTRKKWLAGVLVVALSISTFALYGPLTDWLEGRRICQQLRAGDDRFELFHFTDTTRFVEGPQTGQRIRGYGPQLSPGNYRMTVTSDCYSGECSFVVLDPPERSRQEHYSGIQCRGQGLDVWTRGRHIDGFQAPGVLDPRRMLVHIQRDGRPFWHGPVGSYCPQRGFCVETSVPLED
jgi:hypothetical protein